VDLAGTRITDAGLATFDGCETLSLLFLADTAISDAAVDQLQQFTKLERLDVGNTKVSAEGVARLRAALPRCCIEY